MDFEANLMYKYPLVRYREEKRKQFDDDQSNKRRRVSTLEIFKEKNLLESLLLNSVVKVDDGSMKRIYSSCVFEQVKRYDCNVCVMSVFGKTQLLNHNASKRHYDMMQRPTHPHQNFDPNSLSTAQLRPVTQTMLQSVVLEHVKDSCVLVGTEYVVEVMEAVSADETVWTASCLLCERNVNAYEIEQLLDHLRSSQHRLHYLMLFFPTAYKKLVLMSKGYWFSYLTKTCGKVMKKFGWLQPWYHKGKLSLKEKKAIRHAIDTGLHISEKLDKDFATSLADDIPLNEKLIRRSANEIIYTEFLVNEESFDSELYSRKEGRDTCKLCRTRLGTELVEKIVHPCTGKHLVHLAKGMTVYDRLECQAQAEFNKVHEPLLGLEYFVEFCTEGGTTDGALQYRCMLCRRTMNHHQLVINHLASKYHKQQYIKNHMPEKDAILLKLTGPEREQAITDLIKRCEAKYGRLKPWGTIYDLKKKINSTTTLDDFVLKKIRDGIHIGWNMERDQPQEVTGIQFQGYPHEKEKKKEKNKEKGKDKEQPKVTEKKKTESVKSVANVSQSKPSSSYKKEEVRGKSATKPHRYTSDSEVSNSGYDKRRPHRPEMSKLTSKHKSRSKSNDSTSSSSYGKKRHRQSESSKSRSKRKTSQSSSRSSSSSSSSDTAVRSRKGSNKARSDGKNRVKSVDIAKVVSLDKEKKISKKKLSERSEQSRSTNRTKHKRGRRQSERSSSVVSITSSSSSSSNTSRSLSHVGGQRKLSPELPQEYTSPLETWLPSQQLSLTEPELDNICTQEEKSEVQDMFTQMSKQWAEDQYLTNYKEGSHSCEPLYEPNFRECFEDFWSFNTMVWFNEHRYVFGLDDNSHETDKERLAMLMRIMMETPVYVSLCQPTCRQIVDKLLESVSSHGEAHLVTEAQRLMLARGILRNTNVQLMLMEYSTAHDEEFAALVQQRADSNHSE